MRPDVVPQRPLFTAAARVLEQAQMPLHYKDLTRRAVQALGLALTEINLGKVMEDVREQMLLAGRHGSFYLPRPYCLGGLRRWFRNPQSELFHTDRVRIKGSAMRGRLGAYEALMRGPFMLDKTISGDVMKRNMARARGLVVEQHVVGWMLENWPEFVLPAENEGQYERPCNHDLRLEVSGRIIKVDVAGKSFLTDTYGAPRFGKIRADLHLLCCENGSDVLVEGIQRGTEFGEHIVPEQATSPVTLVVWLNCLKEGLPYADLIRASMGERAAS